LLSSLFFHIYFFRFTPFWSAGGCPGIL
jgi:hypothetical protein